MSNAPLTKTTCNQSINILKLLASFLVVFIHCRFPTAFGSLVKCIARSAVPFFFAVSGFFSYGVPSQRLPRRMKHLLVLLLWGILLSLGLDLLSALAGLPFPGQTDGGIFARWKEPFLDTHWIPALIFLDQTPLNDSLWYIAALLKCCGVLWCCTRFFGNGKPNYKILYFAGFLLFLLYLILGVMSAAAGKGINLALLRTFPLLGFPMFAMGLFLGQYWQRIWENFSLTPKKLAALFFAGCCLSVAEQWTVSISDAHLGSVLVVLAVILLAAKYPAPFQGPRMSSIAEKCGSWSAGIYLVHYPLLSFFAGLQARFPALNSLFILWLAPVAAALLSTLLAMINTQLYRKLKGRP